MIKATLMDHMGSDLTVVNAARVSFGKESHAVEWLDYDYENKARCGDLIAILDPKDQNLIRYLASGMSAKDIEKWKKQMITANDPDTVMEAYNALKSAEPHMSPFGHAFASFHVKAPIFVARQLVKHKFLRWNEISRRYVDDEPEFYVPDVWRGRSADKKQGSEGEITTSCVYDMSGELTHPKFAAQDVNETALHIYKGMVAAGVAPEQARMVLPQSTMTEWWWSGSLDAFASMCKLRCATDTQYETRVVAEQVSKALGDLFPVSWASLVPLSQSEGDVQ
jgi:thymidylate synthase (FAD)